MAILLVWYFTDYLSTAYQTILWPCLGFLFMPLTTLAFAWAWHYGHGAVAGLGLVVVVLAVLIDLALLGASELRWLVRWRHD